MHLFLEPIDVWLFRDGRPFDAESDHRAESLFPPYPTVMQGVIRSHHLVVKGVPLTDRQRITDTVGTTDDVKGLRLRGPFVARQEGEKIVPYFPLPADAVPDKEGRFHSLRPREKPDGVVTSAATRLLLWSDEEPGKADLDRWLTYPDLIRCLQGERVAAIESDALWKQESRFGIRQEHARRVVQEGMLYEASFIRPMPDVGLLVEVNGYDGWPKTGILRIGGEGRGAFFQEVKGVTVAEWLQAGAPLSRCFKLYFATPTYFAGGWQPADGDWSRFFTGNVMLQAAAIRRYDSIGGYDWARNEHKPARRYVPAGSVYFFTAEGEARLSKENITEYGAEIGFGQVIMQTWEEG